MIHRIPALFLMTLFLNGCAPASQQPESPLFQTTVLTFAERFGLFEGAVIAVALATVGGIAAWWRRRQSLHEAAVLRGEAEVSRRVKERRANNRRNMLTRMEQRIAQEEGQTLFHEVYMRLGLKQQSAAIMQTGLRMQRAESDTPAEEISIEAAYDRAGGALLILGEPGAGKSTQLTKLTKALVACAQADPEHPIPVVFNLSSWAQKRPPLDEWLVDELRSNYRISRKVAEDWLARDELLLLLDGLDEVAEQHRAACVKGLNAYRIDDNRVRVPFPMVACSRSVEYQVLNAQLELDDAVCVESLNDGQIYAYFDELSVTPNTSGLTNIYEFLARDSELLEQTRTPLMLNIILLTYSDQPNPENEQVPEAAPQPQNRAQIFDAYIRCMFHHRQPENPPYSPPQTLAWLSWLAWRMQTTKSQSFMIEMLRPLWLPARIDLWMYALSVGLILGLIIGPAAIFSVILVLGQPVDLIEGLGISLGLSLYLSLNIGLIIVLMWRGIMELIVGFNYESFIKWPAWLQNLFGWLVQLGGNNYTVINRYFSLVRSVYNYITIRAIMY